MSKINRKQRKQLARDIAKITGKKITFTLRAFVTPMVQDRKPATFKQDHRDQFWDYLKTGRKQQETSSTHHKTQAVRIQAQG